MNTLSIGWTQADAHRSLTRFRRLLAVNLALQSLVALLCILAPSCGAWITGIEPSLARPLLPVWGGLVLLVSALQCWHGSTRSGSGSRWRSRWRAGC